MKQKTLRGGASEVLFHQAYQNGKGMDIHAESEWQVSPLWACESRVRLL